MMNQIGTWIRRRPIISFFVITFVISWGLGFSAVAVLKNDQFLLMPLAVVTACAPALAGIIVTAVGGGQARPALGRNRARWILFFIAQIVGTAIFLANNQVFDGVAATPIIALLVFFLFVPPVSFIISAAYSRGAPVRELMASLLRLRGVTGWLLLALIFIPVPSQRSQRVSRVVLRPQVEGKRGRQVDLVSFPVLPRSDPLTNSVK